MTCCFRLGGDDISEYSIELSNAALPDASVTKRFAPHELDRDEHDMLVCSWDGDLRDGASYRARVCATNSKGVSPFSAWSHAVKTPTSKCLTSLS